MEYKVKPTKSEHRNKANGNYIVVVNSRLKKRHMLKKFVTVKNLLISNQNEIFIFSTIAKLVIDNKLSDDELALDQTLRIAIGIGADIENAKVKLSALKMSKMQLIGQYIQNGQKLHMRVSRAYVSDMEKKYCRINIDSINVLGTQERKSIIIENAYSEIEQKIKEIYKCYIENNLIGAEQILEEYKNILKNIIIKPEFEYLFVSVMRGATNNNVYSIMNDIFKNKNRMDKRKEIRDLCEYASWA